MPQARAAAEEREKAEEEARLEKEEKAREAEAQKRVREGGRGGCHVPVNHTS
jgi:hypothetical protein